VLVANAAMLAWTWDRCPEAVTDFGRELYLPWRIADAHEVLYRDLNSFNGPLSPYFNAVAFKVLGTSLRTLKFANALLTLATALLIYHITHRMSNAPTAAACGVVFATMFACAHLGAGNFNFLTPYSHELTHGVFLSLAMLACLWRGARSSTHRAAWFGATGLMFGLVLLTKAEVALAAGAGAAAYLLFARQKLKHVIVFILGALAPPLLAVLLLSCAMPLMQALQGIGGSWLWIGDARLQRLPYVAWMLGTDRLGPNLAIIARWTAIYAAIFGSACALAMLVRRERIPPDARATWPILVAAAVAGIFWLTWDLVWWEHILRPLPVILIGAGASVLIQQRRRSDPRAANRAAAAVILSFTTFALALLARLFFNVLPHHYSFALAMPGTMVLIMLLASWLPAWVDRRGGTGAIARAVALTTVAVAICVTVFATKLWLRPRTNAVGTGADRFLADEQGKFTELARQDLARLARRGDTLVVFPEGIMLNYLGRTPSTSRYPNFLVPEMLMYGESAMLAELKRRPPTFVALVHRDTREYGAQFFGRDYARDIVQWVREEYEPVALEGAMPFSGPDFGILIARRRAAQAAGP
jgi:hypothetical protein